MIYQNIYTIYNRHLEPVSPLPMNRVYLPGSLGYDPWHTSCEMSYLMPGSGEYFAGAQKEGRKPDLLLIQ